MSFGTILRVHYLY